MRNEGPFFRDRTLAVAALIETLSATDEVDDFEPILVLERGRLPRVPPHDLMVQLHSHAVGGQLKVFKKLPQI